MELYLLRTNTDKAQKQQLLGVIENIYGRSLKKKYIRNGNHTCLQVINHLKDNYCNITPADLKLNTKRIKLPHNINKLFKTIINQIKTVIYFYDDRKVPYTLEQIVATAFNLILVSGYFTKAFLRWNQKTDVYKTWMDFNSYFVE